MKKILVASLVVLSVASFSFAAKKVAPVAPATVNAVVTASTTVKVEKKVARHHRKAAKVVVAPTANAAVKAK